MKLNTILFVVWVGFIAWGVSTGNDFVLGVAVAGMILNLVWWLRAMK